MVVSRMYMCVKPVLEMCNELMLCEFMHSYTVIVIVTGSRSSLCSQVHMCIDIFTYTYIHTYTYVQIPRCSVYAYMWIPRCTAPASYAERTALTQHLMLRTGRVSYYNHSAPTLCQSFSTLEFMFCATFDPKTLRKILDLPWFLCWKGSKITRISHTGRHYEYIISIQWKKGAGSLTVKAVDS